MGRVRESARVRVEVARRGWVREDANRDVRLISPDASKRAVRRREIRVATRGAGKRPRWVGWSIGAAALREPWQRRYRLSQRFFSRRAGSARDGLVGVSGAVALRVGPGTRRQAVAASSHCRRGGGEKGDGCCCSFEAERTRLAGFNLNTSTAAAVTTATSARSASQAGTERIVLEETSWRSRGLPGRLGRPGRRGRLELPGGPRSRRARPLGRRREDSVDALASRYTTRCGRLERSPPPLRRIHSTRRRALCAWRFSPCRF